jgi:hypothetical protein
MDTNKEVNNFQALEVFAVVKAADAPGSSRHGFASEDAICRGIVARLSVGDLVKCGEPGTKEAKRIFRRLERANNRIGRLSGQRTLDGVLFFFRKS